MMATHTNHAATAARVTTPGRVHWRSGLAAALLAAVSWVGVAQAQPAANWPSRPVKIIVPFAPGGSNDNISRLMGDRLAARLGQPFVIENKGGAGGTIGTDFVAKAAPDGATLLLVSTSITTNVAAGKKLPYDLQKDFEPLGLIGSGPFVVVVANNLKVTTLREFIDLARARPRSIDYGSAGIGGLNHLGTELLAATAKVQLVHVPYKGIGPAFADLMGGTLKMALPSLASMVPHLKAGKMTALAITGAQRSPLAPDLPTVSEAALPGFKLEVWWGLVAPARTPPAIVKRLNDEMNVILTVPEVADRLTREGAAPQPGSPDDFRVLIRNEIARWGQVIREANIQIE